MSKEKITEEWFNKCLTTCNKNLSGLIELECMIKTSGKISEEKRGEYLTKIDSKIQEVYDDAH